MARCKSTKDQATHEPARVRTQITFVTDGNLLRAVPHHAGLLIQLRLRAGSTAFRIGQNFLSQRLIQLLLFHEDVTITTESTWQRVSIYIPADGTAQIDNNAAEAARLHFGFMSNQKATDATWENNDIDHYTTSSTDNLVDATDNVFGITNIQFEPGGVATDFEHEDYGTTLYKCLRHFERIDSAVANSKYAILQANTTAAARGPLRFGVRKRAAPTCSVSAAGDFTLTVAAGTTVNVTAFSFSQPTVWGVRIAPNVASGLVAGNATELADDTGGNSYIDISAEL